MKVLFYSLIIYSIAFFLHLAIWKVRLPKRQTKAIIYIFFGVLGICLFFLWKYPFYFDFFGVGYLDSYLEYCHISIFVVSLTIAYVIFYPAIEADPPSIMIVAAIKKAGSKGINKDKLYNILSNDKLIKPRLDDLLLDKMAYINGNKYYLTEKGKWMARIFIYYRKLLKIEHKGG